MGRKKQKKVTKNAAENPSAKPIREYKDRVFRMIFKDKSKLLELYNAVNETDYRNPEEMTITTLENALYLGMKNDISFILHDQLALYEHQSTNNPNMPLRNLFYISDVYSGLVVKDDLYNRKLVQIPEPKFLVFYNGTEKMPERWEQKLSDAYFDKVEEPSLELRTTVLNINLGRNQELADKCRPLQEYMIFVGKVREYNKTYPFKQAVEMAVADCIREGIMADFLLKNKAEVVKMSIYGYDEARVRQADREYGRQEGMEEGLKQGQEQGLKQGRKQGMEEGFQYLTIFAKLKEGKTIDAIVEESGVESELVERIAVFAEQFDEKYDWSEVCGKIVEIL